MLGRQDLVVAANQEITQWALNRCWNLIVFVVGIQSNLWGLVVLFQSDRWGFDWIDGVSIGSMGFQQ